MVEVVEEEVRHRMLLVVGKGKESVFVVVYELSVAKQKQKQIA